MITRWSRSRFFAVAIFALVFVLWPARTGIASIAPRTDNLPTAPPPSSTSPMSGDAPASDFASEETQARLQEGFTELLSFFAQRGFSLLNAWREMRGSANPDFFDHHYPAISKELDTWAATVGARFHVSDEGIDLSFLVEAFAPQALDPAASSITRDNTLVTICMVCVMDSLRCEPKVLHRFLSSVVADDSSPARQAEALRWWRRTEGFIDEGLLESLLKSGAASDLDLRQEVAQALFSIPTRRSLSAQRWLASTSGLPEDLSGMPARIACRAMLNITLARYDTAAPQLIDALVDPSALVRACAAESLHGLTGKEIGFDAGADMSVNAVSIAQWRSWWHARSTQPSR